LVDNFAILNPMNKHDKLFVIDPKLLISGGSNIHSNDFNNSPIILKDEEL
jgi:phosphatidylserine/phosphatidylglycerophosphate/cardiolipin synthase-like enzyme